MAKDLKLQVQLGLTDKLLGPLKRAGQGASAAGKALAATRAQVKALQTQQSDVTGYRKANIEVVKQGRELRALTVKLEGHKSALKDSRAEHDKNSGTLRTAKTAYNKLSKALIEGKASGADFRHELEKARIRLAAADKEFVRTQHSVKLWKDRIRHADHALLGLNSRQANSKSRLTGLKAKLDAAGISTDNLSRKAREQRGEIKKLNGTYDQQKDRLQKINVLQKRMASTRTAASNVMDKGKGLATQGAVTGAAAGYLFKSQFLDRAAEFEKYKTVLKTVTGSESKAAEAMTWVSDFAARTPYELSEVLESFTRLKSYGIDPMANGMLKTLGDTASAMGKPVMQAVEAMADAVTGENERLKEFGIKGSKGGGLITYEYTNAAGDTLTKSVDASNRKLIQSTLSAIWNEKYAGAMDDQSKTWSGMVSNLSDQWARFTNMAMAAGLFDRMKERLGGLLAQIDKMAANGQLEAWATKLGTGTLKFGDGLWKAGSALSSVSSAIANAVGGWQNLFYIMAAMKLAPLAVSIVSLTTALFGAGQALGAVIGIGAAFAKFGLIISTAVRGVSIALLGLAANPVFWFIGAIVAAIAVMAGTVYLIYKYWEPIKGFFSGLWEDVKAAFDLGYFGIMKLLHNWSPLGLLYNGITSALTALGVEIPEKFKTLGGAIIDGMLGGIFGGMGKLKDAMVGIADKTRGWFAQKLGIHSPSRVFAELGGFTMAGLSQGIERNQNGPLAAVGSLSKQLAQAGVLALGLGAGSAIAMDNRAPLSAHQAAGSQSGAAPITINVYAAPGMDANSIAQAVAAEMAKLQRANQVRGRSALYDQE